MDEGPQNNDKTHQIVPLGECESKEGLLIIHVHHLCQYECVYIQTSPMHVPSSGRFRRRLAGGDVQADFAGPDSVC